MGMTSSVSEGLDWLYARVVGDLLATGGGEGDIDHWIRLAMTQAGAAGFVASVGGVLTLPLALPANFVGTAAVQMRLIAKIAAARGYDLESEEVKAFVLACLLGNAAADALRDAGVRIGARVGPMVLQRLNQTVLSRLLARVGAGAMTRVVPVLGGVIGGGLDAASTRVVGRMAKRVFVRRMAPGPTLLTGPEAQA